MKKSKRHKKVCQKTKLEFQDYKNYLEAPQIERKINYLEKKKTNAYSLKEDQNITNIKNIILSLILRTQQRFKSERI